MSIIGRLTRQLASKGVKGAKNMAYGLLKKYKEVDSKGRLTSKGKERQKLGKAGRAISRASKYSGHDVKNYKYNPKTNRATKR